MIKTIHCCELMDKYLEDPKIPLKYSFLMREYCLLFTDSPICQCITYCPWCETLLPESVRDNYFEILETEYGIVDPEDQDSLIPQEFKSDEWWKKRGL